MGQVRRWSHTIEPTRHHRIKPAEIRGDGATIDRRRLSAQKAKGRAAINTHFEDAAQDVDIRKAPMAVFGKG